MRKLSKLLLALTFALSISTSSYAVVVASWGGAYTPPHDATTTA